MLAFLPPFLRGLLALVLLIVNTLLFAPPLVLVSLLRFVLPLAAWQRVCTKVAIAIAEQWISVNSGWMRLTQGMQWDVSGLEALDKKHWYLVVANHQSWADILVVQHLLNRKVPMLKFFLKKELIWVPVIGLCWWALDFPFMKRFSKAYLEKHPEKKGQDFESTRRACEKFKQTPVAVFNFLEGTRFNPSKHVAQKSPFEHLLLPKAGGMGFVLGAMGDSLHSMIDITIAYPNRSQPSFWEFLCGEVNHVMVRIELRDIPDEFKGKNYFEDEAFRYEFQQWVTLLWEQKDETLVQLNQLSKDKGWSQD